MAFIREPKVRYPIIGLLALGRPSNIAGFVVATIILAINRSSIWSFSHVGEKVFKLSPAITDRNSSFFVMFVGWITWAGTTGNHVLPRAIRWCSAAPARPSVAVSAFEVTSRHTHIVPLGNATRYRHGP